MGMPSSAWFAGSHCHAASPAGVPAWSSTSGPWGTGPQARLLQGQRAPAGLAREATTLGSGLRVWALHHSLIRAHLSSASFGPGC